MLRMLKRRARILVMDDDPSMQRLVDTLLRRKGFGVDVVPGGSQAIEKISTNDYSALLLDVMTPTEGAMTVVRHLREKNPSLLRRVILVTASPDSLLKAFSADQFLVVHKPFTADQLTAAVAQIIGK